MVKLIDPKDAELWDSITKRDVEKLISFECREELYSIYFILNEIERFKYTIEFATHYILIYGDIQEPILYRLLTRDSFQWATWAIKDLDFETFSSKIITTTIQYDPVLSKEKFINFAVKEGKALNIKEAEELCFETEIDYWDVCDTYCIDNDLITPIYNWKSNNTARLAYYLLAHLFETLEGK